MHKKHILIFGAALVAFARQGLAETRDAATAEALFRQGRQAMDAKNYPAACPKFAESQKLDPAAGTLMNLATCEEKVGKLASAWQHWREAIDALPPKDDRIPFARERVDELEKKVPRLTVILEPERGQSSAPEGAKVFRDEIEIGPAGRGVPLPVDPGPHTVTVQMKGRLSEKFAVAVKEGEQKQLTVRVGALDPSYVDTPLAIPGQPVRSSARTLGWVFGGVGVAGAGAAVATAIMLGNRKNTLESDCPNKTCTDQGAVDAAASGKSLLVVNTASFIVAGAGLGLGAYFLLSAPKSRATAALAPNVSPRSVDLSLTGTF
ncbi:MAG TPA: hypothetical protein VJT73_03030 [Polyangiaceae bacterium]|nr:hypothetical protein [Polyangiaceae bacterium]